MEVRWFESWWDYTINSNDSSVDFVGVDIFQKEFMEARWDEIKRIWISRWRFEIRNKLKSLGIVCKRPAMEKRTLLIRFIVVFYVEENYFCWFVFGLYWAMAVSVRGAKKMSPPIGEAPNPIPWDDFLPINLTGNSLPKGNGPARKAAAETENSLKLEKNVNKHHRNISYQQQHRR